MNNPPFDDMNDTHDTHTFQIAIDGPVASGKGTVSKRAAQELGFLYVDTGSMYRATALMALRAGIDLADEPKVVEKLRETQIDLKVPTQPVGSQLISVFLDGEDVTGMLRTKEMDQAASKVSTLPEVRRILVERQQEIAANQSVVMEGRDITFKVLPNADLKIYLTAEADERARRRFVEQQQRFPDRVITFEEVLKEIKERDERDMGRSADPLQIVDDAWVLDTTNLTIDEVVAAIVQKVRENDATKK